MRSYWLGTPSPATALTQLGVKMMETKSFLMSLTSQYLTSSSTPAMVSTSHPRQSVTIKLMVQWHCAWIGMAYLSHIQVLPISQQCLLQASGKLALSHDLVPANEQTTAYASKPLVMQLLLNS